MQQKMKRNLALICAVAAAVGCRGLALPSAPVAAFSQISEGSLFGACLEAVQLAKAPGTSFSKACTESFVKAGAQASLISSDCAELAGRVSEANDEKFLGDGRLVCGRLIRERALTASRPLAAFSPAPGSAAAGTFCDVMKVEALPFCALAGADTPTAAPVANDAAASFLPAAAVVQAPALRTPTVPVVATQQQPKQQLVAPHVVQPAPRLASEPQMSEAAQTIVAGMFPAFAHQVPQIMATGLPKAAPMNTKAEQQPDLNNAGIWSNLAALLHRTG
jgi:hypothetical protein